MSWTSTRARIAGLKSQDPEADVSALQEQLRSERAEYQIRQLAESNPLTASQRENLARVILGAHNNEVDAQ